MKKIIVLIFILTIGSSCRSNKQLLTRDISSKCKQETDSSFLANAREELRQMKLYIVKSQ